MLIVSPSISTRAKPLRRSTSSVLRIGSGESPLARSPASSARALPFFPFLPFFPSLASLPFLPPLAFLAGAASSVSVSGAPVYLPTSSSFVSRLSRSRRASDAAAAAMIGISKPSSRRVPAGIAARRSDDRLGRFAHHVASALAADRAADAREQQAQIVVDLGRRADRRPRIADAVLLADGDGGRNALHVVDVRLLHALQELARVGRQRLDITALTFRVDRIESQRRLPRSTDARHNRQPPRRKRHVDVLQVVGAGTPDDDGTKARAWRIVHSRNRNPDGGLFDDGRNRSC